MLQTQYSLNFKEGYPYSGLQVRKLVEQFEGNNVMVLELPEPNFTRVLHCLNECNVNSNDWGSFDTNLNGKHLRIVCIGGRMSDNEIRRFKGQNIL